MLITLALIVVFILPAIFYLRTLSQVLQAVEPRNRAMSPGLVWLNLIPVFNMGWHFATVFMLRNSLRAEFKEKNEVDPGKGAFAVGLATCILSVCSLIPMVGVVTGIASLVCWIIYWVKMAGYKNRVLAMNGSMPVTAAQA